ncbi:MAG: OmpA family protein [Flavobacteriales bacterium]|nr:OmpA family protein [Flavobacteriales bacterium]
MKTQLLKFTLLLIFPFCAYTNNNNNKEDQPLKPTTSAKLDEKTFKSNFEQATQHLYDKQYEGALHEFYELEKMRPDNKNISFLIGYTLLQSKKDVLKAIEYLEKSKDGRTKSYVEGNYKEENAPVEVLKYLGDAHHLVYNFKDANGYYKDFLKELKIKASDQRAEIRRLMGQCTFGIELVQNPVKMEKEILGDNINSEYEEYAPTVNADESVMIFTSKRPHGEAFDTTELYEDIFISIKKDDEWQKPQILSKAIHSDDHEASKFLSADGQTLLMYKYDDEGKGDIFISQLAGEQWSEPMRYSPKINSTFWEGHASITPDNQFIFFSSDRPGGYGGKDLYYCKKLPNGDWGTAKNCGPTINTNQDEDAPYIHPDGITLYFSSQGHNSIGGYDIFKTTRFGGEIWSTPNNVGYPINTTGNDIFYYPSVDGKRAYYSSHNEIRKDDHDIYVIHFEDKDPNLLTIFKGFIKTETDEIPENVTVSVEEANTGELVGRYKPNSRTGKYLIVLNSGHRYKVSYEHEDEVFDEDTIYLPMETSSVKLEKEILLTDKVIDVSSQLIVQGLVKDNSSNEEIEGVMMEVFSSAGESIYKSDESLTGEIKFKLTKESLIDKAASLVISKKGYLAKTIPFKKEYLTENKLDLNKHEDLKLHKIQVGHDLGKILGLKPIYFALGRASLKDDAKDELDIVVDVLKNNASIVIELASHTDSRGNDQSNLSLSKARAKSAHDYLIAKGVNENQITSKGYGETRLLNKCSNGVQCSEDEHTANRRVEFNIVKLEQ